MFWFLLLAKSFGVLLFLNPNPSISPLWLSLSRDLSSGKTLTRFPHTGNMMGLHGDCKYRGISCKILKLSMVVLFPLLLLVIWALHFALFLSSKPVYQLFSIEKLVDNNCGVYFSRGGCLAQDQVSGTVIMKWPKVELLFSLQFSIPNFISLVCMANATIIMRLALEIS